MNNQRGIILLLPMLVIAGASLATLLALSQAGISAIGTVVEEEDALEEGAILFGCFDEILIQFTGDPDFSATTISVGEASCYVTITNTGGNNRTLTIRRTAQGITRRIEADLTVDPVSVSAMREEIQ